MTKWQKRGCALIVLGIVLVLLSLGLHLLQQKQDRNAGNAAQTLLQQLELNRIPISIPDFSEPAPSGPTSATDTRPAIAEKEYMGFVMIGVLRVPSVGIELPVLRDWNYDLLDIAPCRYAGSLASENMIIMGHNYKTHFRPLHELQEGAPVEFEDVNGVVYRYTVEEILTLHKSEGELLPSDSPLTLFTCTPGGQNRILIRCARQ